MFHWSIDVTEDTFPSYQSGIALSSPIIINITR
jgi:hypothetical protein